MNAWLRFLLGVAFLPLSIVKLVCNMCTMIKLMQFLVQKIVSFERYVNLTFVFANYTKSWREKSICLSLSHKNETLAVSQELADLIIQQ